MRPSKPEIPIEAATSEKAYEGWREDVNDWGDTVAGKLDRACQWFKDAGLKVTCSR